MLSVQEHELAKAEPRFVHPHQEAQPFREARQNTPTLASSGETAVRRGRAFGQVTLGRQIQLGMKRFLDVTLSSVALIALAPLLCVIALFIRLESPGPVLFLQPRDGKHGVPFEILKFSTMFEDLGDASGVHQTTENDGRVTPFGKVLRAKSLDELPQLINVLKGQMSLVGPRPHVRGMLAAGVPYDRLVPYYERRLEMRPGLTGWAQVNGLRGPTTDPSASRARIDYDIEYIQKFSVIFDLKIIIVTVYREFLSGTGL